jgi:hypothetical protein
VVLFSESTSLNPLARKSVYRLCPALRYVILVAMRHLLVHENTWSGYGIGSSATVCWGILVAGEFSLKGKKGAEVARTVRRPGGRFLLNSSQPLQGVNVIRRELGVLVQQGVRDNSLGRTC